MEGPSPTDQNLESKITRTVLTLDKIDINLYRGTNLWKPVDGRAVFGGQVLGQSLVAAGKTKSEEMHLHSMHSYFIRPGNPDLPILYHVEKTRDGRSFSSRTVKAVQNGETIFFLMASYQKNEESPIVNQYIMPDVPPPDGLLSTDEYMQMLLHSDGLSERRRGRLRKYIAQEVPIEVRPINPKAYFRRKAGIEPKIKLWVRAKGHIGDDFYAHRCVAAYISDHAFLGTPLVAFPRFRTAMAASLDHSMWFHSPFRIDEWMLYECESPRLVGGRALVLGRLWRQDGTLAVSVAQEGVLRGKLVENKSESKL